jgi:hypothetical protein
VADLAARIEVEKLSTELGVEDGRLGFLAESDPADIRALGRMVRTTVAERNAPRMHRIGGLTGKVPPTVAGKIAQHAFGPQLSARVASVIDPEDATRLVRHLPAEFLAKVAACLDPERVEPLVRALPDDLHVDVGRQVLAHGEYAALGRLVAVVSADVSVRVVEDATPDDLLRVALYADDPTHLEPVIERLSDERLTAIVAAAEELDPEARALLESRVSPATRDRIAEVSEAH